MKVAQVTMDEDLQAAGYAPGLDYEFVATVHDEMQVECRPQIGEIVGKTAADAIRKAGEKLGFRCPLAGNYEIGRTWAQTH
jgi:DNA polymerase I-like protein with 3'-5' exonuclease and polymerase domains